MIWLPLLIGFILGSTLALILLKLLVGTPLKKVLEDEKQGLKELGYLFFNLGTYESVYGKKEEK